MAGCDGSDLGNWPARGIPFGTISTGAAVVLHRADGDAEPLGDVGGRVSGEDQLHQFALPRRKLGPESRRYARLLPWRGAGTGRRLRCAKSRCRAPAKLPQALPVVMLGLNLTIMAALSMLAIAALVGTRDLGQAVYVALGKADAGRGPDRRSVDRLPRYPGRPADPGRRRAIDGGVSPPPRRPIPAFSLCNIPSSTALLPVTTFPVEPPARGR